MITPTVSQAAREAAAALIEARPLVDNVDIIKHGGADDSGFVQAFQRVIDETTARLTAPDPEIATAVEAEREACAKVAEGFDDTAPDNLASMAAREIAKAIRSRPLADDRGDAASNEGGLDGQGVRGGEHG